MVYEKEIITMSDGNKNVFHSWMPENTEDAKSVVILSHGMAEYAMRYQDFADVLCKNGGALFVEDHRGHGETAQIAKSEGKGDFGYISDKDGFLRVVEDIHEEILLLKERFPQKRIILFGHSFGSFVSQCVIEKYGQLLDGCILCGTAGPRQALMGLAKFLGTTVCLFGGKKRKSKFLDGLAFGSYNSKIKNPRTSKDWLSRDPSQVDKYIAHPWCGFICTGEFYLELFKGLSLVHKKSMMEAVPKNLPVFFIDGTGDPVGDYGKTVKNLVEIYRKNGIANVDAKFYPDARHELLNEANHTEVEKDILDWMGKI